MPFYEPTAMSSYEERVKKAELILQSLLPTNCKGELNARTRMVSLLSTESPCILAQQQFTVNEWNVFCTLLLSYPHYASYEALLASLTSLSPSEHRKVLYEAQLLGPKILKRELKPIHRAIVCVRNKLNQVCPYLKVSLLRELGYSLQTPPSDEMGFPTNFGERKVKD